MPPGEKRVEERTKWKVGRDENWTDDTVFLIVSKPGRKWLKVQSGLFFRNRISSKGFLLPSVREEVLGRIPHSSKPSPFAGISEEARDS